MELTTLDLSFNIAALTIAICSNKFMVPEEAFSILSDEPRYITSEDDKEDMLNLLNQGVSYREIGDIYGLSHSNIYKKLKKYQAKKETSQGGNLSKVSR